MNPTARLIVWSDRYKSLIRDILPAFHECSCLIGVTASIAADEFSLIVIPKTRVGVGFKRKTRVNANPEV